MHAKIFLSRMISYNQLEKKYPNVIFLKVNDSVTARGCRILHGNIRFRDLSFRVLGFFTSFFFLFVVTLCRRGFFLYSNDILCVNSIEESDAILMYKKKYFFFPSACQTSCIPCTFSKPFFFL